MTPIPTDDLVGVLVDGKYRIEKELGRGGMGAVYRARHVGTERTVALKVISSRLVGNSELVERFSREARAAGQLRHPNVVNVTDFGFWQRDHGPIAYLVMEYLDGISLGEVLKEEKKLPLPWVVEILEQVCVAMEKAHGRGIVHRDLKPDNVWLEPNDLGGYTVKVLDFGLARLADARPEPEIAPDQSTVLRGPATPEASRIPVREGQEASASHSGSPALTTAGSILGTPHYMSPEQCLGQPVDHRADIYSLGVIAYEMLTGERPFSGKTITEIINSHVNEPPPPAHEKRSSVPGAVSELVGRAMAKRPEDRPAGAAGFASALRARSEGLGATLRRAFLLYTEHFGTFLLISLLAYLPIIISTVYEARMDHSPASVMISMLLGFIAFLITFSVSIGLIVPAVAHLLVRPLSPIRIEAAARKLRERLRPFLAASVRFYARLVAVVLLGAMLVGIAAVGLPSALVHQPGELRASPPAEAPASETGREQSEPYQGGHEPGRRLAGFPVAKAMVAGVLVLAAFLLVVLIIWLIRSAQKVVGSLLYGPAVIMEEGGGAGALRRSRELSAKIRRPLYGWTAILVLWFGASEVADGLLLHQESVGLTGLGAAAYVTAMLLLSLVIHPVVIAGLALLYFKARQTDGETLADILAHYERDLPARRYRHGVEIPSHFSTGRARLL